MNLFQMAVIIGWLYLPIMQIFILTLIMQAVDVNIIVQQGIMLHSQLMRPAVLFMGRTMN